MDQSARPWIASTADAGEVARLLDQFNREYETPTPGAAILASRLEHLLAGDRVLAILCGTPPVGVALMTLRPSVWYEGPVALLDELYVAPGRRNGRIGSGLLRAAESACRERRVRLMEINVDGEDHDARRFYERHGFADHEAGQGEPQVCYFRELEAGGDGPSDD